MPGSLSHEQLAAAFEALPADVTFVDAAGITRYYSEYRIFSRTPAALDRPVVDCHSPATRPQVARLMSELASGWRDSAEFLTEKDGRPVRVRYLAVRDADGDHLGVLEVAEWLEGDATA